MSPASLDSLLAASAATPAFKADVARLAATSLPCERVAYAMHQPPVKVLRVVMQLLNAEPALPIDRVEVAGRSGCSDFVGRVTVWTADGVEPRIFDFVWDCAWRAQLEGWRDSFGFADQIRAARTYDWDCFQRWTEAATVAA